MSEIPKNIDSNLSFIDVHQKFLETDYAKILSGRPRWARYQPEHISDSEWIEIFDADVDNLEHHPTSFLITHEFIRSCNESNGPDSVSFTKEESKILLLAALCNDWAEAEVGDVSYEFKTSADEELERKEFRKIFEEILGKDYVKQMFQVENILYGTDAGNKLAQAFNAIERICYMRTVLFGYEKSLETDDQVLASHLLWLAAGAICNHTGPLLEYAKIYPPVRQFLAVNEARISAVYDDLTPDIFSQHGQDTKQKQEQFVFEKSRWETRKTSSAEELEEELLGRLISALSTEDFQRVKSEIERYGDLRAQPLGKEFVSREAFDRGIFGTGSNIEARLVKDFDELERLAEACRILNLKIVLTSGSFDMLHIGHARYLEKARQHGDILIVGVDSDDQIKKRKGENRPIVSQDERLAILASLRSVDVLALKEPHHVRWDIVRKIRPHTLIATAETYSDEEVMELEKICGRVVVLPPQAETSTSARIRRLFVDLEAKLTETVPVHIARLIKEIIQDG